MGDGAARYNSALGDAESCRVITHQNKSFPYFFSFSVSLAPNMDFASYVHQYYPSGYLIYQSSGIVGKVCADNMNNSVAIKTLDRVLTKLGESTCSLLEYQSLVSIDIVRDDHEQEDDNSESTKYVDMVSPMSRDKSFINAPCVQK